MSDLPAVVADRSFEVAAIGAEFTATSLLIPKGTAFDDWCSLGRSLQAMQQGIHWWLGDWLRFGEAQFGEKYAQAVEDTGFAEQTLQNDVWVASAIPASRRREELTFSHHSEVAALPPAEQDEWLDKAERGHWTRERLRREMGGNGRQPALLYDGPGRLAVGGNGRRGVDFPKAARIHGQQGQRVQVKVWEEAE